MKLAFQTLGTFLCGVPVLGMMLFLPAWTFNYWQAWVFIVVFSVSTNAIGVYLSLKDPALLERRKKVGPAAEARGMQKVVISLGFLSLLGVMIVSALAHRFGWSPVPLFLTLCGDVLVVLGLFINLLVFRENSYGGASIEIVENQRVISTGLYALVRHPMYMGVLVMMIGIPLALDSWWSLAVILLTVPALVIRILDEEKMLRGDLPGYTDYAHKVRFRLVPYLW
jgi:protein-S-isoprenylcysteine O-methyltransferase Ste14